LALYIFNFLPVFEKINIDISVYIILIYAILHCFSSFFETYYNRQNKTIYILLFSLISLAIYLFLLFVVGVKGIISLSLYMMIYMIVNMFLLLTKLKSLK
jgi:O-antigen/teichoic acid export membrane protein